MDVDCGNDTKSQDFESWTSSKKQDWGWTRNRKNSQQDKDKVCLKVQQEAESVMTILNSLPCKACQQSVKFFELLAKSKLKN